MSERERAKAALGAFEAAWLRGVFQRALSAALVSSLGAAGCEGGADDIPCEEWMPIELQEIEPAAPVDYLALVNGYGDYEHGERCSGAADVAACEAELEKLIDLSRDRSSDDGCIPFLGCMVLFTTSGDEVKRYDSRDEVVELLAPIDTVEEARVLIEWAGYEFCTSAQIKRSGSSFEADTKMLTDPCPVRSKRANVRVREDGTVEELSSRPIESSSDVCVGRRPEGLTTFGALAPATLGEHLAHVAALESASVAAFELIALELTYHGAPAELIAAARAAARDEVRHAVATAQLAQRFGGVVRAPHIREQPLRSLEALALDNATEGCVRETFGALIGHHQAAMAADPDIAALMQQVAEDETRHAALSHQIDRWLSSRLPWAARERIATARAGAVQALRRELAAEPAPELQVLAGIPSPAVAQALLAQLSRDLWEAA